MQKKPVILLLSCSQLQPSMSIPHRLLFPFLTGAYCTSCIPLAIRDQTGIGDEGTAGAYNQQTGILVARTLICKRTKPN